MKKAIAAQFNWIFVLIVGALIIAFFVFVVQKQRASAKTAFDADVKMKLQSIFTTGQQSSSTLYTISMPKAEISYDCEGFAVGDLEPIRMRWTFAPSMLKSKRNKLFISSADFNMPFKALSFIYVTTPDVRYVFNKSPEAQRLFYDPRNPSMPDNVTKEVTDDCKVQEMNNYKVRFVFVNNLPDDACGRRISRGEVTAVSVNPEYHGLEGYGKVYFYELDDNHFIEKGASYYLGIPTILGAIYSDSKEMYDCAFNDALERLSVMADIYYSKAKHLSDKKQGTLCGSYYADYDIFKRLKDVANSGKVNKIYEKARDVENFNKLLSLYSCPLIY